jgi:hypothetical protein
MYTQTKPNTAPLVAYIKSLDSQKHREMAITLLVTYLRVLDLGQGPSG